MKSNMNIEQLGKVNERIKIYATDEELQFSSIKSVLNNINYNYDTDNTIKLEELDEELINKLKKINKNHNLDMLIIDKNINKYKELNQNIEKIFKNLMEK